MKVPISAITKTIEVLLRTESKRATKYLSSDLVVSAHRKSYGGKLDRRDKRTDIVLKIGKPNYQEREFIKLCKKAKEPFPVKHVQIKAFSNR